MSNKFSREIFLEIKTLPETGYWQDSISLDKRMIENNKCPKCRTRLAYLGFSNLIHYKAFGFCAVCEIAKLFWTEVAQLAVGKKKFSKAGIGK